MYWIDGSVYKGEWKRGIQHGQGKIIFSDGSIKEGRFENNVLAEATKITEAPIQAISPFPTTTKKLPQTDDKSNISPNATSLISGGGYSALNGSSADRSSVGVNATNSS